jgi:hypothetical protein
MEKISGTNYMRNEEGLQRVKKKRKANWVGHVLLRICLLKHVIKGKIEVTGRRGGKLKQLLGTLKEKRIY